MLLYIALKVKEMKLSEHLTLEPIPVIYGIQNTITKKWYIGSTTDVRDRFVRHVSMLKNEHHHSQKLQRSFDKYGIDSFEITILYRFEDGESAKEMLAKEEEYISLYNSYTDGYNMTDICRTPGNFSLSDESKLKVGQSHYRSVISIDRKTGIFEKQFKSITEAAVFYSGSTSNISQVCKGELNYAYGKVFVYSEDYDADKDYHVEHHAKGKHFSEEHRMKMAKSCHRCKAIIKYDIDGNIVEEYFSRSEAERQNGLKREFLRLRLGRNVNGYIYKAKI